LIVDQLYFQRHLPNHVRRAAQARIKRAYNGFDAVQHAFLEFFGFDIFLGDLSYGFVVGKVVVLRGDDHVDFGDDPLFIHFVVVNQSASGSFCDADAFAVVDIGFVADAFCHDLWVFKELLGLFHAEECFD